MATIIALSTFEPGPIVAQVTIVLGNQFVITTAGDFVLWT